MQSEKSYVFNFCIVVELAPSWVKVTGKLRQLDVSPSDVVWGVNRLHRIYLRNEFGWKNLDGFLKHVSVGDAGVWGVTRYDHIYFREGITENNLEGTGWSRLDGKYILTLKQLAQPKLSRNSYMQLTRRLSERK